MQTENLATVSWVVLPPYTNRSNVYPIGQPLPNQAGHSIVAEVFSNGGPADELTARPRLVAAAPDLLAACLRNLAVSSCDGLTCKTNSGTDYCVWCQTRNAINKAQGPHDLP